SEQPSLEARDLDRARHRAQDAAPLPCPPRRRAHGPHHLRAVRGDDYPRLGDHLREILQREARGQETLRPLRLREIVDVERLEEPPDGREVGLSSEADVHAGGRPVSRLRRGRQWRGEADPACARFRSSRERRGARAASASAGLSLLSTRARSRASLEPRYGYEYRQLRSWERANE